MSQDSRDELIGAVVVTTFSRTELLKSCLQSVLNATSREKIHLVVVLQKGIIETEKIVSSFMNDIDTLIIVDGSRRSVIENINFNRALAYDYCFDTLRSPWVLGIEDDTQISRDAIVFSNFILKKYSANRSFRICNLGSKDSFSQENEYSIFRWGILGQGSTISANTWRKIKRSKSFKNLQSSPLDGIMEHFLKTGFCVFPNRSRIRDEGWSGTHSNSNSEDEHFKAIRDSFVENPCIAEGYLLNQIRASWRFDQVGYKRSENIYYLIKNLLLSSKYSSSALRLKKFFRKLSKI